MLSLEEYIATEKIAEATLKKISKTSIETQGDKIWLYFEIVEKKRGKVKEGEEAQTVKTYKYDLAKSWGFLQDMYETYVATDMLRQGYKLVVLEGGWIVTGGEDVYQLSADSCTCWDFTSRLKSAHPCKHLIFKDWHNHYRARCNEARINLSSD